MKTLKLLIIFYAIVAFPYLGLSAIPDPPVAAVPAVAECLSELPLMVVWEYY